MTMTLWIIGMLISCIMTAYIYKRIEFGKMLIVGSGLYFSIYILAAGVMIFGDRFNIVGAQIITLVFELIITVVVVTFNGLYIPRVSLSLKKYIGIVAILIAAGIISATNSSEAYGTGQDEGLYQIRAWYYMTNENGNVLDFSEYYNIESDTEKKEYIQYINTMVGYYRLTDDDINDEKVSLAKGVTHGILTFPALLGLWGKLFGIHNMNGILTFMFILSIGNVWLTCNNLKLKGYMSLLASAMMTVCPILIWSSRNVLTEIVLSMLISLFVLLLTENKKHDKGILSALPMCAACFYHVSITIFIPIVVIVYLLMIFATRKGGYAIGLALSMVGYVVGFFMMFASSHAYTYSSFEIIFSTTKDLINGKNLNAWVVTPSVIVFVIALVLAVKPIRLAITSGYTKAKSNPKKRAFAGWVFTIITILLIGFTVYRGIVVSTKPNVRVMNMGAICYLLSTGFVFLPAALIGIIANRNSILKNKNYILIYSLLLYILAVYCDFVWILIYKYFYYARYFTPYVCIVVLAGAIMLNRINWKITVPVVVICGGIVVWQSAILYTSRDMTAFDYEVLESIASCVGENDAVIILDQGYNEAAPFALPIRACTSADIYFAQDYDLMQKIEYYSDFYQDVYIVLYDVGTYTDEDGTWRYVYRTKLEGSYYDDFVLEGTPYPKEVVEVPSPFALLVYEGEEK